MPPGRFPKPGAARPLLPTPGEADAPHPRVPRRVHRDSAAHAGRPLGSVRRLRHPVPGVECAARSGAATAAYRHDLRRHSDGDRVLPIGPTQRRAPQPRSDAGVPTPSQTDRPRCGHLCRGSSGWRAYRSRTRAGDLATVGPQRPCGRYAAGRLGCAHRSGGGDRFDVPAGHANPQLRQPAAPDALHCGCCRRSRGILRLRRGASLGYQPEPSQDARTCCRRRHLLRLVDLPAGPASGRRPGRADLSAPVRDRSLRQARPH